jgi:cation transporter-like permease
MSQKQTSYIIFRSMIIVHLILCLGIAVSTGVLYTLSIQSGKHLEPSDAFKILELLLPLFGIGSFFGARLVINRHFKSIPQNSPLNEKLEGYRASMIILWAMLAGTALFGAIGFFISGRQNLLLYGLMAAVFVLYFRPLKTKIAQDLNLEPDEVEELNQQ